MRSNGRKRRAGSIAACSDDQGQVARGEDIELSRCGADNPPQLVQRSLTERSFSDSAGFDDNRVAKLLDLVAAHSDRK